MERIGVSAWDSPSTDTETLMTASYAIITCARQFGYNRNRATPHFDPVQNGSTGNAKI